MRNLAPKVDARNKLNSISDNLSLMISIEMSLAEMRQEELLLLLLVVQVGPIWNWISI